MKSAPPKKLAAMESLEIKYLLNEIVDLIKKGIVNEIVLGAEWTRLWEGFPDPLKAVDASLALRGLELVEGSRSDRFRLRQRPGKELRHRVQLVRVPKGEIRKSATGPETKTIRAKRTLQKLNGLIRLRATLLPFGADRLGDGIKAPEDVLMR